MPRRNANFAAVAAANVAPSSNTNGQSSNAPPSALPPPNNHSITPNGDTLPAPHPEVGPASGRMMPEPFADVVLASKKRVTGVEPATSGPVVGSNDNNENPMNRSEDGAIGGIEKALERLQMTYVSVELDEKSSFLS